MFPLRSSSGTAALFIMSNVLRRIGDEVRSLFSNRYFYIGIGLLLGLGVVLFVALNYFLLPDYTRHDETIAVPRVVDLPYEQAAEELRRLDLRVERETQRFDPDVPRDVVVDQLPAPDTRVKPGRRVYVTVNTGEVSLVTVPRLEGFSPREAGNQLRAVGLRLGEVRADSVPHPYQNTVTRQEPVSGTTLRDGESVSIWVSTGPGEEWVTVPDVTGMTVAEAEALLLSEYKLRSRVLGAPERSDPGEVREMIVTRQSNTAARVRQGYEVRLHVDEAEEEEDALPMPDAF